MAIDGGPYLSTAFLCERALREVDGVNSFIRVVDRWTVSGPEENMPATVIQATLVVAFKSGIHRGNAHLLITPITPSDQRLPTVEFPILFEGDDDRGITVMLPMQFPATEKGVYWFQVALDQQTVSYIPLRVIYHRDPMMTRSNQPRP